eukprot:jgi/Orpsp1_1/1192671/evm.model.d7180000095110.1
MKMVIGERKMMNGVIYQRVKVNQLSQLILSLLNQLKIHKNQVNFQKLMSPLNLKKKMPQLLMMNLWMSEVDGRGFEGTNPGEMGAALWLANRIIFDLSYLRASAWILWQVIDNHICKEGLNGKKDTGMVNLNRGYWGIAVADHDEDKIILTQKYYGYGQFTRYIRPGYTIIATIIMLLLPMIVRVRNSLLLPLIIMVVM